MNEHINMSIPEKLTAFVDGELPQEESGDLFFQLASNPELQDELRRQLIIKNSFKNSMLIPPIGLKSSVMRKTVYNNNAFYRLSQSLALLAAFLINKTMATLTGVLVLAGIALFLLNRYSEINSSDNISLNKSTLSRINTKTTSDKQIPITNSFQIDKEASTTKSVAFNIRREEKTANAKYLEKKQNSENTSFANSNNSIQENIIKDENKPIAILNESSLEKNSYFSLSTYNQDIELIKSNSSLGRFLDRLSISFRTFDGSSNPNFTIGNNQKSLLNNFSIALMYGLDYHQSIGVVYGNENFLMGFEKYESDILYAYSQSYNSQWIGLSYSYTINEILGSGIRPDFNLIAGGTNVVPVFKMGLGLSYDITDYFSIRGGFESGWLFYPNTSNLKNSKWYSTNKLGYNIGFNIGL